MPQVGFMVLITHGDASNVSPLCDFYTSLPTVVRELVGGAHAEAEIYALAIDGGDLVGRANGNEFIVCEYANGNRVVVVIIALNGEDDVTPVSQDRDSGAWIQWCNEVQPKLREQAMNLFKELSATKK